jgi:hypothetical protein
MDNVQKHNNYINIPQSQTFRSRQVMFQINIVSADDRAIFYVYGAYNSSELSPG